MAKSPARTVGGISYDAALSDGHSPNMAMRGEGREVLLPASLIVQPPEEPVVVSTSFAAEFRQNMRNAHASVRSRAAKTQKKFFRQARQGTSLRAKPVNVALLATPFVANLV